jgi:hypothetical protein
VRPFVSIFTGGVRALVGLFLLATVIVVAVFAIVGIGGGDDSGGQGASPLLSNMDYKAGYDCAQSAWQIAQNDPNAQADPAGTIHAMTAGCNQLAKKLGVSSMPSFRKGFHDGFVKGPQAAGEGN